jgi:hypothetical protein
MADDIKTRPTDADVRAFLERATPAKRRADGLALAEIFGEVTGEEPVLWGPSIVGYGSYRYVSPANPRTRGDWPKTGFSPRKAQLSLYGLKDLPEGAELLPPAGHLHRGRRLRLREAARGHRPRRAAAAHRHRVVAGRRSREVTGPMGEFRRRGPDPGRR